MFFGAWLAIVSANKIGNLLIDRSIHIHRENSWGRAVDCHRYRCARRAEIKARIELFHVVERGNRDARITHLAINIGLMIRVETVECHRVEGGAKPLCLGVFRQLLKTAVGAKSIAFACKHAGGIFGLALKLENACSEREAPGHVFEQKPFEQIAVVAIGG